MPAPNVAAWPSVSEPARGYHFQNADEAARAWDSAADDLDVARAVLATSYRTLSDILAMERAGNRRRLVLETLAEMLNGLVDLDANTTLPAIERQQEAEEWAQSTAGRKAVAR